MPKTTLTAIKYTLPSGVTTHTWSDKTTSTLQGDFDRVESDGYVAESYSITAHYDHATDTVCTVVLNACNHSYADNAFKAQRGAITAELIQRCAIAALRAVGDAATPKPADSATPCPVCGRPVCLAPNPVAALELIVKARDVHADTGYYPFECDPDSIGYGAYECFDDWAADLAESAINTAKGV